MLNWLKQWLPGNLSLVFSLVIGLLASLSHTLPTWLFPHGPDWLRFLSIILNSAGLWLSLSFWAAFTASTNNQARRRALTSLVLLLLGYYFFQIIWGQNQYLSLSSLIQVIAYWIAFALAAALVFGHLGWQGRSQAWPFYVLSLTSAAESLYRLWLSLPYWNQDRLYTASWLCMLGCSLGLAIWKNRRPT